MPSEDVINSLPVNTILTDVGRQKRALAIISGTTVKIEKFVVGDSNGDSYIPVGNETSLRNEKYRTYIGSMGLDKNDKSTLQISSVIPEDIGGFAISEYGLIDADGDLIAIGTCDPINKPNPSEGKIYSLAMVLIMTVLNAVAFEFLINYDGYVTYQYLLDEYVAQTHNIANGAITSEKLAPDLALPDTTTAKTQPLGQDSAAVATMKAIIQALTNIPDATTAKRGLIQLATNPEALAGADASKSITAYSLAAVIAALKSAINVWSNIQYIGGGDDVVLIPLTGFAGNVPNCPQKYGIKLGYNDPLGMYYMIANNAPTTTVGILTTLRSLGSSISSYAAKSRTIGIAYTNSSLFPIFAIFNLLATPMTATTASQITINGNVVELPLMIPSGGAGRVGCGVLIPAGATYVVTSNGINPSIESWYEIGGGV